MGGMTGRHRLLSVVVMKSQVQVNLPVYMKSKRISSPSLCILLLVVSSHADVLFIFDSVF